MENKSGYSIGGYIQVPIQDKTITSEIAGDFTLPDYQPEIKRLLKISSHVLPPSKYIGDSEAEFAGNIDYYVFYTGSDNEVYCAPLTTEYKIVVPTQGDGNAPYVSMTGYATITPDMVSGRVTAPRKLSIKCRLKSRARIFGEMPIDSSIAGSANSQNEILYGNEDCIKTIFSNCETISLSDEIIIDSRDGESRVISCEGRALVGEIFCSNNTVNCRGEVYLKLLINKESNGEITTNIRKIPFSHTMSAEGANGPCSACATGKISEISVNVEDSRISIDVSMILSAQISSNQESRYVKDVYSTTHSSECTYKNVKIINNGAAINSNFTFSDSSPLDNGLIPVGCSIIDNIGSATVESASCENGRCVIGGKIKYSLLLSKDGEYSCSDIEFPFKYSTEMNFDEHTFNVDMSAEVISSRIRVDGERIGVDSEIAICGQMWDEQQITMLDSVSYGDEKEDNRGECIICYPSSEDTLWSVGKRYASELDRLARSNNISTKMLPDDKETLMGVKYLII